MFKQIRYQTGEINEIISEMEKGMVPCMDVDDSEDMARFIKELSKKAIYVVQDIPYDKNARDRIKEPEFEYRVAFYGGASSTDKINLDKIMFIDFYFEPDIEETYDSIMGD